jgi:hypothetical protein
MDKESSMDGNDSEHARWRWFWDKIFYWLTCATSPRKLGSSWFQHCQWLHGWGFYSDSR